MNTIKLINIKSLVLSINLILMFNDNFACFCVVFYCMIILPLIFLFLY